MTTPISTCMRCGGSNLEPGAITYSQFVPAQRKFFTLTAHAAAIFAVACLDCGHVELTVDPAKVTKLVQRKPDPRRGFPVDPA